MKRSYKACSKLRSQFPDVSYPSKVMCIKWWTNFE